MKIIPNGYVGIGTDNPQGKLHLDGAGTSIWLTDGSANPSGALRGNNGTWIIGYSGPPGAESLGIGSDAGALGDSLRALTLNAGGVTRMKVLANGDVGVGTDAPQARLDVVGTTRTCVLQITGGCDLAERLTVCEGEEANAFHVEPGMAVSIDPTRTRRFKLSDEPYDRKRVGIISGGNGVKPGLLLQDDGNPTVAGDQPVALTGQVWCHGDASFGAIHPGDLITTSRTPGHVMKVTDFDKARFAVLGQALTGLEEGRGWVQILVGKN
jgi:hypothetical protein